MNLITLLLTRAMLAVTMPRKRDERGDVPGWVLITVMTAALVGALWQIAGDRLSSMLTAALDNVHG